MEIYISAQKRYVIVFITNFRRFKYYRDYEQNFR